MITGDVTQIDLPNARRSGLLEAAEVLKNVEGLTFAYFDDTDVVRHQLVQRIIRAYDEHKAKAAEQLPLLDSKTNGKANGTEMAPGQNNSAVLLGSRNQRVERVRLNRRAPGCGPPVCFWPRREKPLTAKDAKNSAKDAKKNLVILRKPVAGLSDTALAKFVARASRASKLEGTVNVLVTGSSELRSLNRRFRGKDQPTDVLSFPPGPCFVNGLAGDIAISADIAKQNARRLGHSAAQEIKILALARSASSGGLRS